jgi:hypothetical protein
MLMAAPWSICVPLRFFRLLFGLGSGNKLGELFFKLLNSGLDLCVHSVRDRDTHHDAIDGTTCRWGGRGLRGGTPFSNEADEFSINDTELLLRRRPDRLLYFN